MGKINTAKVIVGGLLAGLVMNIIDFITNVPVLGAAWREASLPLNIDMEKWGPVSAMGWITVDFICGILLVWLYAAIRPRFGAGAKTAILAGIMIWLITHLMMTSYAFNGIYPVSLVIGSSTGALVAALAGSLAGCSIYKEG